MFSRMYRPSTFRLAFGCIDAQRERFINVGRTRARNETGDRLSQSLRTKIEFTRGGRNMGSILRFLGSAIGIIFLIGLLVVIGILMLIF